jgi:hypothetical protein
MSTDTYLLDANVLITAKNTYYGFQICPGFWDVLLYEHKRERVFSVEPIQDELLKGDDDLSEWVRTLPSGFFIKCNRAVTDFGAMQKWAALNPQFMPAAKEKFARVADGWLMATAKVLGFTVVTQEKYNPDIKREVPIPNVCKHFSVKYMDTFAMLNAMKASFTLKGR